MKRVIQHIRSEQFTRKVRYIGDLIIYFKEKDTILAIDGKSKLLCERWFESKGFYARSWRPFAEALTRNNSLKTTDDVLRLAHKYGISTRSPSGKVEIDKDAVVLPEVYKRYLSRDFK